MSTRTTSKPKMPSSVAQPPQTFFVDQPSSYQTGPYVTKLTFGVIDDDGTDSPRPVITLAIPTVNLMRMVEDLQQLIQEQEFKEHNLSAIEEDLRIFYGFGTPPKKTPNITKRIKKIS